MGRFHEACDGKGPTLTIIRVETGRTIFAFANAAWNSSGNYIIDHDNSSCIVLMGANCQRRRIPLTNKNYSIKGDQSFGPIFGDSDLRVEEGNILFTQLPSYYNDNLGDKCQKNFRLVTGVEEGQKCRILDYEVHQLFYPLDVSEIPLEDE